MAVDADNILIAANGTVFLGDTSATAPTDAVTDPTGDGFLDVGLIDQDGVGFTPGTEILEVRSWGQFYPTRTKVTGRTLNVVMGMQEIIEDNLAVALGGGSWDGEKYTPPTADELSEYSMIVDGLDGEKLYRWYFPRVQVTNTDEMRFTATAESKLVLTFSTLGSNEGGDAFNIFTSGVQS